MDAVDYIHNVGQTYEMVSSLGSLSVAQPELIKVERVGGGKQFAIPSL